MPEVNLGTVDIKAKTRVYALRIQQQRHPIIPGCYKLYVTITYIVGKRRIHPRLVVRKNLLEEVIYYLQIKGGVGINQADSWKKGILEGGSQVP